MIVNTPILTENNIDMLINFIDQISSTELPDEEREPEFLKLVKPHQLHRHSKLYRKYRDEACQINFGKYFTNFSTLNYSQAVLLTKRHEW